DNFVQSLLIILVAKQGLHSFHKLVQHIRIIAAHQFVRFDKSTLNQLFLQSFAVRAVFLPFLRGCHALPNHLLVRGSAVPVPPREVASAESTFQLTAESKFSTVLVPLASRAAAAILASSMQYVLRLFKY